MLSINLSTASRSRFLVWGVIAGVLVGAALVGTFASPLALALLIASIGAVLLFNQPVLGLVGLVIAAVWVKQPIGTGTEVELNAATLLIPLLSGLWVLTRIRRKGNWRLPNRIGLPLLLFLIMGLISLLVGNVLWNPMVPRSSNFILVQLAQWTIFAFSAGVFVLAGNLIPDEKWLRRVTCFFLLAAGIPALLRLAPGIGLDIRQLTTIVFIRAPFWALLTALAGGQLLFNRKLSLGWRVFCLLVVGATAVYVLFEQQEAASNWVGVGSVVALLVWLRWPHLRWPIIILIVIALFSGFLWPLIWQFAGGAEEWNISGGSRLVLAIRVIEDTLQNPITGLGPAAYRLYGATRPLLYQHIVWVNPRISSHNNYVDLFSHVGLVGLVIFFWFVIELGRLGIRLRSRYSGDFAAGYINGVLAAGGGGLVLMLFADWILPFVYNIGFPGFQASLLLWLFLGGLLVLADRSPYGKPGEEPAGDYLPQPERRK